MYKKSWRPFFTYILIFSVVWVFIIPWGLKDFFRRAFFSAQIPVFKLSSDIEHQQISQGVGAHSKDFWVKQTRELFKENAYLKLQLAEQKEVSDLAQRILQINKVSLGENFKCLVARVIHRSIEMWYQAVVIDKGFPPHLYLLKNGDVISSYGYRFDNMGIRARISKDGGDTWSDELFIVDHSKNPDLGYPSTIEMNDGTFLTVYYMIPEECRNAGIYYTKWIME